MGIKVQIFEQAEVLQEVGWALDLEPNAMRVYQHLGVADELQRRGRVITEALIRSWNDKLVYELPVKLLIERLSVVPVGLHRAALQEATTKRARASKSIRVIILKSWM